MPLLRILYVGDIMGRPGREVVQRLLPGLRRELKVDAVIAQAENVSHGKSIATHHVRELQESGVDFFTAGNHTMERPSIKELLADPNEPIIAPLNQEHVEREWAVKTLQTDAGKLLITSLLGTVFPEGHVEQTNPLQVIDELYEATKNESYAARIVNLHSDFSSEKRVIGYYLDGRASLVVGDHWHVPTADAMILPHGTAHITDVGMCGTLHSSLGVSKEIIISRWRDNAAVRNEIAEGLPYQLNAVLVGIDTESGLARNITSIQRIIE